eukprot:COSAG02_NODE_224_length_28285_cov_39.533066_3_plen_66_part_00
MAADQNDEVDEVEEIPGLWRAGASKRHISRALLVGDGHGARRAGADDPPGCHQGSVADPDREDEG